MAHFPAGRRGSGRRRGHRRRAPPPRGGRSPPGHPEAGGLPGGRQGQPAHAPGPLRGAGLAQPARAGPHPRPGPRPSGASSLKVVSVRGVGFPHASQVLQVTRKVRDLATRRWRTTVVYAVTSLAHAHAGPARLADLIRGHRPSKTACTTSATKAFARTPPTPHRLRPAGHGGPWATRSSAPSAAPGRSTSPPRSESTAATPADHPHPTTAAGSGRRRVSTTGPPSVIASVCSEWAVREPSAARIVQPSGSKAI
jgi:hypothetical protein